MKDRFGPKDIDYELFQIYKYKEFERKFAEHKLIRLEYKIKTDKTHVSEENQKEKLQFQYDKNEAVLDKFQRENRESKQS